MNIKLDLPNPLEQELSLEATRLNMSLSDYILKVLMLRRDWLEEVEDSEDLADAKTALLEDGFIPLMDVKRECRASQFISFGMFSGSQQSTEADFRDAEFNGDVDDALGWV